MIHPATFLLSFVYIWTLSSWAADIDFSPGENVTHEPPASENPTKCQQCHQQKRSSHPVLQEPQCQQCHDPDPPTRDPSAHLPVRQAGMPQNGEGAISQTGLVEVKTDRTKEIITQQKMVLIPAGEFTMGNNGRGTTDGPGDSDETPTHKVYVDAFYMDQYETTNAMYQEFVQATGHRPPKHWKGNSYPEEKANHPVVYVDWYDADAFCQWAKKRLPKEEEWEKSARGTDGRIFPWGNTYSNDKADTPQYWLAKGVSEDNLGLKGGTLPVGSFENGKSPYHLYDMAGNVYEWTSSWYLPYPGNKVWNIHYGNKNKVLRGGSWYDCLNYGCGLSAPTYNRSRFSPEIRNMGFGFRCAKNFR